MNIAFLKSLMNITFLKSLMNITKIMIINFHERGQCSLMFIMTITKNYKTLMFIKLAVFKTNAISKPYNLGRRLFQESIHGYTQAHKSQLDPFWREVEFSIHFQEPTELLQSKWLLADPVKHGKGFHRLYPKHASTLFKLAMRSLPLQDRFLSQLPLPPCSMCKNGPDSHLHTTQCDLASQAWSLVSNQSGLQLGGLTEGFG